ncbi:MAG: hypothetical protein AAGC55_09745 [Myxococcota bacterium]
MSEAGRAPSRDLPGYEQVRYSVRGPHTLLYSARDGVPAHGPLTVGYEQYSAGGRRWSVEVAVDRAYLLPLAQASLIALSPPEILGFTIIDPVTLIFAPRGDLVEELDAAEDGGPLLSPTTGVLDARVRGKLVDLHNLTFVRARQDSA